MQGSGQASNPVYYNSAFPSNIASVPVVPNHSYPFPIWRPLKIYLLKDIFKDHINKKCEFMIASG